jgi:hypothetical protein
VRLAHHGVLGEVHTAANFAAGVASSPKFAQFFFAVLGPACVGHDDLWVCDGTGRNAA